jgi:hypothetical protein
MLFISSRRKYWSIQNCLYSSTVEYFPEGRRENCKLQQERKLIEMEIELGLQDLSAWEKQTNFPEGMKEIACTELMKGTELAKEQVSTEVRKGTESAKEQVSTEVKKF